MPGALLCDFLLTPVAAARLPQMSWEMHKILVAVLFHRCFGGSKRRQQAARGRWQSLQALVQLSLLHKRAGVLGHASSFFKWLAAFPENAEPAIHANWAAHTLCTVQQLDTAQLQMLVGYLKHLKRAFPALHRGVDSILALLTQPGTVQRWGSAPTWALMVAGTTALSCSCRSWHTCLNASGSSCLTEMLDLTHRPC